MRRGLFYITEMIRQLADHFVFRFNAEWGEELLLKRYGCLGPQPHHEVKIGQRMNPCTPKSGATDRTVQ